jgi:hypothetical protein
MHLLPDIFWAFPFKFLFWFPVLGFWSNSGGNKSSSSTETLTSSGQNSPNASEGSQALGSGSIGVSGTGAKYLEQGAVDQAGAQIGGVQGSSISASSGGTIQIGDPQATQTIAALAQNFADTVSTLGSGGGGSTVVTGQPASGSGSFLQNLDPTTIILLAVAALGAMLLLFRGGKKA